MCQKRAKKRINWRLLVVLAVVSGILWLIQGIPASAVQAGSEAQSQLSPRRVEGALAAEDDPEDYGRIRGELSDEDYENIELTAAEINELSGYTNPERIIIASPDEGYATTSKEVSILGACDYRYPLYLEDKLVSVTEHGFFTVYVSLEYGENSFTFRNGMKQLTLHITRTKPSGGGGGGSSESYKAYDSEVYGVITNDYAMPRSVTYESDSSLIAITEGTELRLLGEKGSYYRIYDGSYVAKSSIKRYAEPPADNKVDSVRLSVNEEDNTLVLKLGSTLKPAYTVESNEKEIIVTIMDTTASVKAVVEKNDTVSKIRVETDKEAGLIRYHLMLWRNAGSCGCETDTTSSVCSDRLVITGYDAEYDDTGMQVILKRVPHLKERGSLRGAVVLLDAGHGGEANGALGPMGMAGMTEKDINLSITMYAADYLRARGATVHLVRDDDTDISLSGRVEIIRRIKPDISISIHGNSLPQSTNYGNISGYLTYYSYRLFGDVPGLIDEQMAEYMGFTSRGTNQKSLSLTRFTCCPAVLLETRFLSNPEDYEQLIRRSVQRKYAEAVCNAAEEYLTRYAVYSTRDEAYKEKITGISDFE